jgi:hypothetical protein
VAVEDQPSRCGYGHLDGPIGRRAPGVLIAIDDLELEEAPAERGHEHDRGDTEGDEPGSGARKVEPSLVQVGHRLTMPAPLPRRNGRR